ncbi:hypothetical protein GGI42DRAFT_216962 [Trichoderma sp. SZMC 28013]
MKLWRAHRGPVVHVETATRLSPPDLDFVFFIRILVFFFFGQGLNSINEGTRVPRGMYFWSHSRLGNSRLKPTLPCVLSMHPCRRAICFRCAIICLCMKVVSFDWITVFAADLACATVASSHELGDEKNKSGSCGLRRVPNFTDACGCPSRPANSKMRRVNV